MDELSVLQEMSLKMNEQSNLISELSEKLSLIDMWVSVIVYGMAVISAFYITKWMWKYIILRLVKQFLKFSL